MNKIRDAENVDGIFMDQAKLFNLKTHLRTSESVLSRAATVTGTESGSIVIGSGADGAT